jgi:hypothetical protein
LFLIQNLGLFEQALKVKVTIIYYLFTFLQYTNGGEFMPKAVLSVGIRYLDQITVDEFYQGMTLDEYLYQEVPSSLPRLIERDYVRKEFRTWANDTLQVNGFNPNEVNLRYAAIDVVLDPIREGGKLLSFPFMINSSFTYNGLNIHGPFVAGHQAGMSMVQTFADVKYARFFLPERFSGIFTSDYQTSIIANSIYGIINNKVVDGFVAALPDRGRDPDSYIKSSIGRVLTGGHITDAALEKDPLTIWHDNPLRGIPYKPTSEVFSHRDVQPYAYDFTYYSFLPSELHNELLYDRDFLKLTDLIRKLGPMFKAKHPDLSEGLLFNPSRNIEFIIGLLNRSMSKGA